jgi:hypothetical protein
MTEETTEQTTPRRGRPPAVRKSAVDPKNGPVIKVPVTKYLLEKNNDVWGDIKPHHRKDREKK